MPTIDSTLNIATSFQTEEVVLFAFTTWHPPFLEHYTHTDEAIKLSSEKTRSKNNRGKKDMLKNKEV